MVDVVVDVLGVVVLVESVLVELVDDVVVVESEGAGAVVGGALAELVEPARAIDWNVTPERFASCWS